MKLKDAEIRGKLRRLLAQSFQGTEFVVTEELGLDHGMNRIDVAVVGATDFYGFEIKSDVDSLKRLPSQAQAYSLVLDYSSLVVTARHCDEASTMIPQWWGLYLAEPDPFSGRVRIRCLRIPQRNPDIDLPSLLKTLWKDDCLELLALKGEPKGWKSSAKWHLRKRLGEICRLDEVRNFSRSKLKEHAALGPGWKLRRKQRIERFERLQKSLAPAA